MKPLEKMPDFFCKACDRGIDKGNYFCGYCGTYHLARQHRILRYDGVYVTRAKTKNGIIMQDYFRFYPDGFVIGIFFGSRRDAEVATWWGRRSNDGMKGFYRLKGRDIELACMAEFGAMLFSGRLRRDGVRITSCNGTACSSFYRFVYGREGEYKRDPLLPRPDSGGPAA